VLCGVLCCCAVLCCTDSVYDRNESCDGAGVLWSPGLGEGGRGKGEGGRGKGEGGRGKGEGGKGDYYMVCMWGMWSRNKCDGHLSV